jgi:hypothetical protein
MVLLRLTNYMEQSPSLEANSHSRNSLPCMEPKDSLLCSQDLTTGPYPEPVAPGPYFPFCFSMILFNIITVAFKDKGQDKIAPVVN